MYHIYQQKLSYQLFLSLGILSLTCMLCFFCILYIDFMSHIYQQNLPYPFFGGFENVMIDMYLVHSFMLYIYQQNLPYQLF